MSDNKLKIDYKIVAMCDSHFAKNFVDIFLEPADKTALNPPSDVMDGPSMIIKSDNCDIPSGLQQMLLQIPKHMQNINRQMNKNLDPRGIMIVEDPIEVKAMGWRYGDVISVSFEKRGKGDGFS